MKPKRPGWYWFLPDEHCPTPTGLLRLDRPIVVLVGHDKNTRDMPPAILVVRFGHSVVIPVARMSGDWEPCKEPRRMRREVTRRIVAKRQENNQ